MNAKNQIKLKQGGKPMNLTEYVNLNHHLYINDNFLETLLNQGEIQFKRSSYSNDRNHVERDSGFIASYNIVKNDEDQKSDATLHVHIGKIDVTKKRAKVMTTTFAYLIHALLNALPNDTIEVSLHQSAMEVSYKEKSIYQKLLPNVRESNEIPYIYGVFTVNNREADKDYYQTLIDESDYQIKMMSQPDYQRLPIDRLIKKQEALTHLKPMIGLDLEINHKQIDIPNVQKLQNKYSSSQKVEKRICYIMKKVDDKQALAQLVTQYISEKSRYEDAIEELPDKDISELFLMLENDIQYINLADYIPRSDYMQC